MRRTPAGSETVCENEADPTLRSGCSMLTVYSVLRKTQCCYHQSAAVICCHLFTVTNTRGGFSCHSALCWTNTGSSVHTVFCFGFSFLYGRNFRAFKMIVVQENMSFAFLAHVRDFVLLSCSK